jgi:hypothetical protein
MADHVTPTYRYITTDLVSNRILAEIPFTGVSYTNAVGGAGDFSGSVYVDTESRKYDLYNSTMPGKTGLYILRNNECVWGGIIWSREYDIDARSLSVNGLEFTSYLYHRKVWKTFATTFGGSLAVPQDGAADAAITLDVGTPFALPAGLSVRVIFASPYENLTTYFEVLENSSSKVVRINPKNRYYRATHKQVTKLTSDKSVATVKITTATNHGLILGDTVTLSSTGIPRLDGTRVVSVVHNAKQFSIKVPSSDTTQGLKAKDKSAVALKPTARVTLNGSVPPGTYAVSVDIKPDTYSFIKGLVESTMNDFTGLGFPNYAIEAGDKIGLSIASYKSNGGVATLTTSTPHGYAVGESITVRNLIPQLNGEHVVSEILDDSTFSYEVSSNPVSYSETSQKVSYIKKKYTKNKRTTFTFTADHDFYEGDYVTISRVPSQVQTYTQNGKTKKKTWTYNDSSVKVVGVPASTQITVNTSVTFDDSATIDYSTRAVNPNAYATSDPIVVSGSYGPFPYNANIGITFNDDDAELLGLETESALIRGFEVKTVGEILDQYAVAGDGGRGFDYRIDCSYDPELQQFVRVFRFIPFYPGGEIIDTFDDTIVEQLGAGSVVFEYPGNITKVTMTESAEDSATRFFMVGNDPALSGEASQPYSASALVNFLDAGWPVLDASESTQDTSDEFMLYAYASRYVGESAPPIMDFSIDINGSLDPVIGTYSVGQWCSIIINDEFFKMRLESDDEPRDDLLVRKIIGMTVSVPDSGYPESVTLELMPISKLGGPRG